MEIELSETQQLIRSSLRELLERETPLQRVRELERAQAMDEPLWEQLAKLGWLGLPFSPAANGGGASITDLAVAVEEFARHAALVPYAEVAASGLTLERFAEPGIAEPVIGAIMAGTEILVPAVLDAADSYTASPEDSRSQDRFSGRRLFVDFGQSATRFLVRAGAAWDGALLLVSPQDGPVTRTPLATTGRVQTSSLAFTDVPAITAARGDAYAFLLDLMRCFSAVQCLGAAQQALDMTAAYVRNRVQFGRPIGSFQAVQHHMANMATLVESTRFMVYEAVWALEQGSATPEQLALAKSWAADASIEVAALAHQLHGGIGVTEEYDLHFFTLRIKERSIAWGGVDECMRVAAAHVANPVDWL
jgi:alkylation response protein AidB-like acyl-CoA dehydrogenase